MRQIEDGMYYVLVAVNKKIPTTRLLLGYESSKNSAIGTAIHFFAPSFERELENNIKRWEITPTNFSRADAFLRKKQKSKRVYDVPADCCLDVGLCQIKGRHLILLTTDIGAIGR